MQSFASKSSVYSRSRRPLVALQSSTCLVVIHSSKLLLDSSAVYMNMEQTNQKSFILLRAVKSNVEVSKLQFSGVHCAQTMKLTNLDNTAVHILNNCILITEQLNI